MFTTLLYLQGPHSFVDILEKNIWVAGNIMDPRRFFFTDLHVWTTYFWRAPTITHKNPVNYHGDRYYSAQNDLFTTRCYVSEWCVTSVENCVSLTTNVSRDSFEKSTLCAHSNISHFYTSRPRIRLIGWLTRESIQLIVQD